MINLVFYFDKLIDSYFLNREKARILQEILLEINEKIVIAKANKDNHEIHKLEIIHKRKTRYLLLYNKRQKEDYDYLSQEKTTFIEQFKPNIRERYSSLIVNHLTNLNNINFSSSHWWPPEEILSDIDSTLNDFHKYLNQFFGYNTMDRSIDSLDTILTNAFFLARPESRHLFTTIVYIEFELKIQRKEIEISKKVLEDLINVEYQSMGNPEIAKITSLVDIREKSQKQLELSYESKQNELSTAYDRFEPVYNEAKVRYYRPHLMSFYYTHNNHNIIKELTNNT